MNLQRQWEAPFMLRKWPDLHLLLYKIRVYLSKYYTHAPNPLILIVFLIPETLKHSLRPKEDFYRFKFSSKTTSAPHGGVKHPQIYVANMWPENWAQIYKMTKYGNAIRLVLLFSDVLKQVLGFWKGS